MSSAWHGRQPNRPSIADGLQAFELRALAVERPLVVVLEHRRLWRPSCRTGCPLRVSAPQDGGLLQTALNSERWLPGVEARRHGRQTIGSRRHRLLVARDAPSQDACALTAVLALAAHHEYGLTTA